MRLLEPAKILEPNRLSDEDRAYLYNGLDCCITAEVFERMPKASAGSFPYDMCRTMQGPAFVLMKRGIRIDRQERDRVLQELQEEHNRTAQAFNSLCMSKAFYPCNYASPQQIMELFYDRLGFKPVMVFDKGAREYKPSTGRQALEKLHEREEASRPFIELLLHLRDLDKQIQVLSVAEGDRMHCSYHPAGTMTGRWSSSESAFGGGTNLQNITDRMRRVFIADEGKKLCQLDLKQAESKVTAYCALPWGRKYLDACLSGDPHTIVAKMIWKDELPWGKGLPDKTLAKQIFYRTFSYRDFSKKGGHASNYLVSPFKLALELKIPLNLAEHFMRDYFQEFPEIRQYHNWVRMKLVRDRFMETPLGRRCHFPGRPWDNETIKAAVAYVPQSTIGDILNLGLLKVFRLWDEFYGGPIQILLQVHDAIVFQYPEEWPTGKLEELARDLVVPFRHNGELCRIGADVAAGFNWGKVLYDEQGAIVANPYGLAEDETTIGSTREERERKRTAEKPFGFYIGTPEEHFLEQLP